MIVPDLARAFWRKSSRSADTNCVEVAFVGWRKSSYSNGTQADCVEVAFGSEAVAVRDSKNASGPTLVFPASGWAAFLGSRR
ncbi:DUF397 domain-containing protein [Solihabitans fulvus]|uniref:DUF397 domain-containing protein n=1 Tax=Solihabitans fulvus TaxID=1892852 RepID=A0A5B2WH52_9PSEU|nr:DUF397 domain-containing protein [Solihabitans fulvus]KAA2251171.1 DUF397 domain-containing protein [Solihabitans fulvus]